MCRRAQKASPSLQLLLKLVISIFCKRKHEPSLNSAAQQKTSPNNSFYAGMEQKTQRWARNICGDTPTTATSKRREVKKKNLQRNSLIELWVYMDKNHLPCLVSRHLDGSLLATSLTTRLHTGAQSRERLGNDGAAPSPTLLQVWSHLQPSSAATSSWVLSFSSHSPPLHFL